MEETRKFLRYIIPGLVFVIETTIILWIILPNNTYNFFGELDAAKGAGFLIAALIASGGLGYIFDTIHHNVEWIFKSYGNVDYERLAQEIRRLYAYKGSLEEYTKPSEKSWVTQKQRERLLNIALVTSFWCGSLKISPALRNINSRLERLYDIAHSAGSAAVASLASGFMAIGVFWSIDGAVLLLESKVILRFSIATAIWIFFTYCFAMTFRRIFKLCGLISEDTLLVGFRIPNWP
jgi:hypothetical protein